MTSTPASAGPREGESPPPSMQGLRVAVALSGGIACYKTGSLISRLVQHGAETRVLMTEAATHFVTPLTFRSLSGMPVLTSIWQSRDHPESPHVGVARWCDLFLLAPASADVLARLAHGLTDDIVALTACALPRETPRLIAPAMNEQMWENPIVQRNAATLREQWGAHQIGPDAGWQACRTRGAGRMSEPDAIFEAASALLNPINRNDR